MKDAFQFIPKYIIQKLSHKLDTICTCQAEEEYSKTEIAVDTSTTVLILRYPTVQKAISNAMTALESTDIENMNSLSLFQYLNETVKRAPNQYYAIYGSTKTVEKLAWSSDRIMSTCEDSIRDEVRDQLMIVLHLEAGGISCSNGS